MGNEKEIFSNRQLKALIIPLILEQILGVTVGMADTVMVSGVGEAAVSGVSLVDSINILLINIFVCLSTGGAVVAAHRLGEKNRQRACKTADQLLLSITGTAVLIMVISLAGNRFILTKIFGNVEIAVMENAVVYFYLTALSFPFLGIYSASTALLRSMGNSKTAMYTSILMNIMNVTGNAILIFVFHMGVFGVAFSTLLSRVAGAVIMLVVLHDQKKDIHYERRFRLGFQPGIIKDILRIGIPTGLDNCIFQVGKILVQSLVAGFGTAAIAANAIVGVVAGCAVIPASAVGTALITVVGQSVGAGAFEEARRYTVKLIKYAYLFMALLNTGIILMAGPIVGLYHVSPEASGMAKEIVIFHSICAALLWPLAFSLPNVLRASFDAPYTMVVSIGSMWIFRVGFSYLLGLYFEMGLMGVWAAMAIDWLFRSICFLYRVRSGKYLKKGRGMG